MDGDNSFYDLFTTLSDATKGNYVLGISLVIGSR